MAFRILRVSLLASVALCAGFAPSTRADEDDPSQRRLPLPQRQLPDLNQQMELLKKLRSEIEARRQQTQPTNSPESKDRPESKPDSPTDAKPPFDPQQLSQLQNVLKNLRDQLPPGFVPPNLNSIPPEQLKQAMENPAVQQQMRDLLKQFSRDGVLPPAGANGSENPSLPRLPPMNDTLRPRDRDGNESPAKSPSQNTPAPNPSSPRSPSPGDPEQQERGEGVDSKNGDEAQPPQLPPSSMKRLQDFLKGLAGNAAPNRPQDSPSGNAPPNVNSSSPKQNGADSSESVQPKSEPPRPQPLRRKDRGSSPGVPQKSKNGSTPPRSLDSEPKTGNESASPEISPQEPSATPRSDNSQRPLPNLPELPQPAEPDAAPAPFNGAPSGSLQDLENKLNGSPEDQAAALNKLQDLLQQMAEQQSTRGTGSEGAAQGSEENRRSGGDLPSPKDPSTNESFKGTPLLRNGSMQNPGAGAQPGGGRKDTINSLPSVPEFLKEQLKNMKLSPNSDPASTQPSAGPIADASQRPENSNSRPGRNSELPRNPSPNPMEPPNSRQQDKTSSPIDVAKELERRGFGETLKKIVEKAKQDSRNLPPTENNGATSGENENHVANSGQNAGSPLDQSTMRILDRLKDDLVEIAKDAKFREPSESPRPSQPQPLPIEEESNSTLDSMRKVASEMFTPPATTQSPSSTNGSSSNSVAPTFDSQFDFTPALVLAGILATVALAFFGARYFKLRTAASVANMNSVAPLQPSEVQNRADVIRAFHEFAMRSTKSVQSWWTHREVERVIATTAPDKRAAVETLADTYELARYLPQEMELSSEDLQSARKALQQCATGS